MSKIKKLRFIMSGHTKTHLIKKDSCEVIIKMPGHKNEFSYIPMKFLGQLKSFLRKYEETGSVDWKVVAKDSIAKHKQAGMILRGARFRENLTQKKLAQLSGVSQENISRIENGKRSVGEKLAKKLAVPLKIDYLLLIQDLLLLTSAKI
jgi:DNA-binding XRE family transcriptional regulator